MKTRSNISKSVIVGLVISSAITVFLAYWTLKLASADNERVIADRLAKIQVMALAELIGCEIEANNYEGVPGIAGIAESWQNKQVDVHSVRVIKLSGSQLLYSSLKDDLKEPLPRRLQKTEKSLYDLGQQLKTATEINQEEKISRKKEIELAYVGGNRIQASTPYFVNKKVEGYVQLEIEVSPPSPLSSVGGSVFFVLIVFVIFWIIAILISQAPNISFDEKNSTFLQFCVALLIMAIGFYFYFDQQASLFSNQHALLEKKLTVQYLKIYNLADEIARSSNLSIPTFSNNRWDTDEYRQPLLVINPNGSLNSDTIFTMRASKLENLQRIFMGNSVLSLFILVFFSLGWAQKLWEIIREYKEAYLYITPAMLAMLVLVFFPFFYGITLAFTDANVYNTNKVLSEIWIGLSNFYNILLDFNVAKQTASGLMINYENFYWTLFITIMWTIVNVAIGVTIGLVLAMFLNTKGLALRPIYRVLLILPWAIPNYITALIWRGMFHQQFGVFNQIVQMFGGEPIAWFDGVFTSFCTGIACNGWLSFPFMMVMCLGGLQSISEDMYEAARLDGATKWQQFRYVTLPSLKPVLVPAVIISVVWTFNMFNIIFLVSGGEPGGANEILITQAYKIAFEKYRYGYAAAYSTVIFFILFVYGNFQIRMTKATEANV